MASDRLAATFRLPFAQQLAAWRLRLGELRGTATWTDVAPQFHDRGFMVAGALKADLLADLAAAVDKAITAGTSLEEFRRDFRKVVQQRGWHGWTGEGSLKGEAWRTRVIYRTNLATTYAAGRRAQLIEGDYAFWVYLHGNAREPRVIHLSWNGLALPPDHPFWASHSPPNGWGCTCYIVGARTAAGVRRVGGEPDKPLPPGWDRIDPKTGVPVGIDKGWAYAPGARNDDLMQRVAEKVAGLPASLGDDLAGTLRQMRPPIPGDRSSIPLPPDAGDMEAVARWVVESGLSHRVRTEGLISAGLMEHAVSALEVAQRFRLPTLRYFGTSVGYTGRMPKDGFEAFYDPVPRALVIPPMSTDAPGVREAAPAQGSELDRLLQMDWEQSLPSTSSQVQRLAKRMAHPGWVVDPGTIAAIATHEQGHALHFHRQYEVDRLLADHRMIEEGWPLLVSGYARTEPYEFFAESLCLYLRLGEDQRYRLHPALLAYFMRLDGANR